METIIVFCLRQRMGRVTDMGAAEQTDVIEVQLQEVSSCESVCVCVCVWGGFLAPVVLCRLAQASLHADHTYSSSGTSTPSHSLYASAQGHSLQTESSFPEETQITMKQNLLACLSGRLTHSSAANRRNMFEGKVQWSQSPKQTNHKSYWSAFISFGHHFSFHFVAFFSFEKLVWIKYTVLFLNTSLIRCFYIVLFFGQ